MPYSRRNLFLLLISLLLAACTAPITAPAAAEELTILYTGDEHGWMEGMQPDQGAANLMSLWRENHGYTEDGPFLILSGGDNWTGPAISTWFRGESMVEVMNAMGYAASAVGNHEFDFGLYALEARAAEAEFPYLSANLRYKKDGSYPASLGIEPYTLVEVGDLRVGVIGLTTTLTPGITDQSVTGAFDFVDYAEALRETVPQVEAEGADLILVVSHICVSELKDLAESAADLGVDLLTGGHCHEQYAGESDGMVIISGGQHLSAYAYATLTYDPAGGEVVSAEYGVAANRGGAPDGEIAGVISDWQAEADEELNVEIGYLDSDITRQSAEMEALITEAWLAGHPNAQVALTNWGGMRDRIPAGPVTLADITGVMPFSNTLVEVALSGEELLHVLRSGSRPPAVGGLYQQGGQWRVKASGESLDREAEYVVLVNSFMYGGGDQFSMLARYDPQGFDTSIDWRQPVIDWIRTQNSSPSQPLDTALEALLVKR